MILETRTTVTDEQLADLAKTFKKKGADRVLGHMFFASIPFVIIASFFSDRFSPSEGVVTTIIYLLTVAAFSQSTI